MVTCQEIDRWASTIESCVHTPKKPAAGKAIELCVMMKVETAAYFGSHCTDGVKFVHGIYRVDICNGRLAVN